MYAFPIYGTDPEKCVSNSDCGLYPYEVCDVSQSECEHKKVFPPTMLEIAGLATFSFVMALCVVAGIGGGGIAVSLIIAFFKFTTKPAVAASSFSILINSIMRYFYNWNTRNPSKKGMVLIDYSLATVMSPTTLAGSQIGSLVLESFPDLYIQVLLTLLLGALGIQSARKALELHRKEEEQKRVEQLDFDGTPATTTVDTKEITRGVNQSTLDSSRGTALTNNASTNSPLIVAQKASDEIEEDENNDNIAVHSVLNDFISIAGKKFKLGKDAESDKELHDLNALI